MINIVKKKLEFDDELKKKIEFICGFCNTTPIIINGNIRKIDRTNLSYIGLHRIIIKGITFLAFNYSKTIYVGNLSNKLEINELESFIKQIVNKNNYTISNSDIDKRKKYIEQTNDTTSNLKDFNDINVILDKYEQDLRNHSNEVKELKKKITTWKDRISDLENRLDFANDTIDMLEDKVDKLREALDYFKELWKKFIKFLQDKFFSSNKYDDLIDELHEEEIIDDNDLNIIQNEYSNYRSKDDDLER